MTTFIRMTPGIGAAVSKAVSDISNCSLKASLSELKTRSESVRMAADLCKSVGDATVEQYNKQAEAEKDVAFGQMSSAITSGVISGISNGYGLNKAFKADSFEQQLENASSFNKAMHENHQPANDVIENNREVIIEPPEVTTFFNGVKNGVKDVFNNPTEAALRGAGTKASQLAEGPERTQITESVKNIKKNLQSQLKEAREAQQRYMNIANQWGSIAKSAAESTGQTLASSAHEAQGNWEANKIMRQYMLQNVSNIAEVAGKGYEAELMGCQEAHQLDQSVSATNSYAAHA